jgi:hypothetical protein
VTVAVSTGWDRTTQCCKAGCHNDRGRTSDGVESLSCQYHTDLWEARLRRLENDHSTGYRSSTRVQPVEFVTPTPPPVAPLDDAQLCSRCHQQVREWPDHLCEECRRG